MKKTTVKMAMVALVIVMSFGLCSCSVINGISHYVYRVNQDIKVDKNSNESAKNRAKTIVDALKSKDIKVIKKLFSKSSVSKISQIDSKLNSFVNYCQGNFVSYKYTDDTEIDNAAEAVSTNYIAITYTTDESTYIIGCADITLDSANKDNMGLLRINIYNKADSDKINRDSSYYDTPDVTLDNG